jgi:dTDP-4-dehydrorhamnose reductase
MRGNEPLELWGGIECTVNRVRDDHFDQLRHSGHDERSSDLDLVASLGIRTLRYPVLWERVERDGWAWSDERLARLRELGIRPIVGLVHHGSGPLRTNLLDPGFATGLAEFAGAVAERYPWVELWTPVNEPLTTARFSALYGHWYPHARDDASFARALLNECRAVVLSMEAIRAAAPGAQLVQTEDVGKTHATELLRYQAELENERRWLSLDLLTGTLAPERPMWDWLRGAGVAETELSWFLERPCPPDLVGINHYLSGERFLDERLEEYPPDSHGGNGRHEYADVLAARVLGAGADGPAAVLREAWERYGLPIAVTEAHNGCTREEQLRWLDEIWRAAHAVRDAGVDVRAVTVWSLFGAYGWADLCRSELDGYEPGVFDLAGPSPRPTALAAMARGLATEGRFDHPVLAGDGWWRRPERLWYPVRGAVAATRSREQRPLLVTGATGTLGQAFARLCEERGLAYRLTSRSELDAADPASVAAALEATRPWALVNTAGYVRVDEAESEPELCLRENRDGAAELARACARAGIPYLNFSSDLVFDGALGRPYVEGDQVGPLNVYGRSKADAEELVLEEHAGALVVRTAAFFGPWDEWNFIALALGALADGSEFRAADDLVVSPTYVPDLVHASLDLLIDGEAGIVHLAGADAVSWHELAQRAAEAAEVSAETLVPVPADELGWVAARPRFAALGSQRVGALSPLSSALARYVEARPAGIRAGGTDRGTPVR